MGGYTGVSQSEQNGDAVASEANEMSENDRKVIQELKDWDLWYVGALYTLFEYVFGLTVFIDFVKA